MEIKLKIDEELLFNLWKEIEDSTNIRLVINSIKGWNISVTLDCRYVPNANNILLRLSPPLDVDLYVVGVRENTIILKYVMTPFFLLLHGRFLVDHIKNNTTHRELEILTEERRVLVHLDGFRKMKKLLSAAQPIDVALDNDTMTLNMILI